MTHTNTPVVGTVTLPAVTETTIPLLDQLIKAIGVPREILASNEDISTAWQQLPALLTKIPPQLRDPLLARMCVAVSVGLLDAAINYAWNSSIIELRNKVRAFGVTIVPQVIGKPFDDQVLDEMQDSELLGLCLSLNLLTEEGFFMLDQSRDVRNNFSAAHPPIGTVDAYEYLNFLNRCAKHALNDSINPRGVDVTVFISAVKGATFNEFQRSEWIGRIKETHQAQREALISILHGIYCDPAVGEEARLNALGLAEAFAGEFTAKTKSELVMRHTGYSAEGKKDRHSASQQFFSKLSIVGLLSEAERHTMVVAACKRLMSAHQAYNNFYNETPFAERLLEISSQSPIPDSAKEDFVETVVTCSVGNQYGTCRAADVDYTTMIRRFSPKEVDVLFQLFEKQNVLTVRVRNHARCKTKLRSVISMINEKTIPARHSNTYKTWTQ
jgi:hypothetical protein